jgi:hypothetical protein
MADGGFTEASPDTVEEYGKAVDEAEVLSDEIDNLNLRGRIHG